MMKIKNKIIISIILLAACLILGSNYSQAASAKIEDIVSKGKTALGEKINLTFATDMNTPSNDKLYCLEQGQHFFGTADFRVLTYMEIENGCISVWDVNHPDGIPQNPYGADVGGIFENRVLAEILSGNYGLGYGGGHGAAGSSTAHYSAAQMALYQYVGKWFHEVGMYVGTDVNWSWDNAYTDTGAAAEVIANAEAAVKNGANPSVKIFLLDHWNTGDNWQRLLVAVPGVGDSAQLLIQKLDELTGARLKDFGFKIQKDDTNEYVIRGADGTITYNTDVNSATEFKTDAQGMIKVENLLPGYYNIIETTIPDPKYNKAENQGKTVQALVDTNAKVTIKITNKGDEDKDKPPKFDDGKGTVSISGTVWEATLGYKDNSYSDTFNFSNFSDNKGNIPVQGVKVTWWNNAGTTKLGETTTDSNGNYKMTNNITIHDHVYNVDSTDWSRYNNSYVVFEYNGFKYTTVKFNNVANGSRAKEIPSTRAALDGKFKEVTNGTVKDGNFSITTDKDQSGDNYYTANVGDQGMVQATSKSYVTNLMSYATASNSGASFCTEHTPYTWYHHGSWTCGGHTGYTHKLEKKNDTWEIKNMNLGLVQREQPDVAISSDIEKVRVIMKGQQYTYVYGNRGIQSNTQLFEYRVKFGGTYTRKVNPADIAYINQVGSNEMEVYVTYNIIAKNHSNTLKVSINDIANYYDNRYTINSGDGWTGGTGAGNGFNVTHYNQKITLEPNAQSDIISIEFKVNDATIKGLLNNDMTLKNVSEITSYTSFYGTGTIGSEHETASTKGLVGTQYAGVDRNSIPGNYNVNSDSPYEDDTMDAPSFLLTKDPNYKIVSGNVYEDTTRANNQAGAERNGDGANNSEPGVGHARVELLRVKDDGSLEVANLYTVENGRAGFMKAITYTEPNGDYAFGYNEGGTKPRYYTNDSDATGSDSYIKIGVVADNYVIRYTYGDGTQTYIGSAGNIISARNYKSTIITPSGNDSIYGVIHNNNGNDKWHLTATDKRSIAVDDLGVRNSIDTSLKHSTFNDTKDISAYSKPFKVQLEYTQDQTFNVEQNGNRKGQGDFEHNWGIFDFGIAERAREDIIIDKTISNLKITLANGQVLMDGNPRNDTMDYLRYLGNDKGRGPNTTRNEALTTQSKLTYIEMDTELIQGATLDIIYTITVSNRSERDYDYRTDEGRYYYYGDKSSSTEMQTTVELVADYMDPELTCYVNDDVPASEPNHQWVKTTAAQLEANGLISTKGNIELGNYLVFMTTYFNDVKSNTSKSLNLHASKLLANSADDYIYENHVEILQTNGQIARTIDKVDYAHNSTQVTKTYIPGNYIPSTSRRHTDINGRLEQVGLHQQDDDAITITITPPTGVTNYYTQYIIAVAIGLIVLVGGIIIIKKKVLKK